MADQRGQLRLLQKPSEMIGVRQRRGMQHLDGGPFVVPDVGGRVDLSHAAGARESLTIAGAYLALRMDFLFELAPVGSGAAAVLLLLLPFISVGGAAAARVLPARARPSAGGSA